MSKHKLNLSHKHPLNVSLSIKNPNGLLTWIGKKHTDGINLVIRLCRIGNGITRTKFTISQKQNPFKKILFNLFQKKRLIELYKDSLKTLNNYCMIMDDKQRNSDAPIIQERVNVTVA